jgi:ABC-type uncharacterized transport system ATPase subunit
VCIIARGKKLLDGNLKDIKRLQAGDGMIALEVGDASRATAEAVLADRALVADTRAPRAEVGGDWELKLAEGVTSQQLLAALVHAQISIRRFEVVVPTLHQIFVDQVGASATVAERRPEAA